MLPSDFVWSPPSLNNFHLVIQSVYLSTVLAHIGGKKSLPCWKRCLRDTVDRRKNQVWIHRCLPYKESIQKCKPLLGNRRKRESGLQWEKPCICQQHRSYSTNVALDPRQEPAKHIPVIPMFFTNTGLGFLDDTEKAVVLQYKTLLPRLSSTYKLIFNSIKSWQILKAYLDLSAGSPKGMQFSFPKPLLAVSLCMNLHYAAPTLSLSFSSTVSPLRLAGTGHSESATNKNSGRGCHFC